MVSQSEKQPWSQSSDGIQTGPFPGQFLHETASCALRVYFDRLWACCYPKAWWEWQSGSLGLYSMDIKWYGSESAVDSCTWTMVFGYACCKWSGVVSGVIVRFEKISMGDPIHLLRCSLFLKAVLLLAVLIFSSIFLLFFKVHCVHVFPSWFFSDSWVGTCPRTWAWLNGGEIDHTAKQSALIVPHFLWGKAGTVRSGAAQEDKPVIYSIIYHPDSQSMITQRTPRLRSLAWWCDAQTTILVRGEEIL